MPYTVKATRDTFRVMHPTTNALLAWGTIDATLARVQAHLDAGADHVCIQVLDPDGARLPMREWAELSSALGLSG